MNHMQHDPDPDFVSRLENQLTAEYRRQERLGLQGATQRRHDRWLRPAGFLLAGLLIGCGSMATAQRIERSAGLELLRQQAALNIAIATERVALTEQVSESVMARVDAGTASPLTLLGPAPFDADEARLALSFARLDLEELEFGGDPSRNDVSAPLVGQRDYFSLRLEMQQDMIARHAEAQQQLIRLNELRVSAGTELASVLPQNYAQRDRLAIIEDRIAQTLALRKDFLEGRIDSEEAELRHRLLLTLARQRTAQVELTLLQARDELFQQRLEAGLVPDREAIAAAREMLEAEAAVQLAGFEAELLARRLAP